MAVLCLRRLLALFLPLLLSLTLVQARAVATSQTSSPTPTDSAASDSVSDYVTNAQPTNTVPSISIRATTLYIISESYTYDPTTFSTTTIYETILPTTRSTHSLDPDLPNPSDYTSPSPFSAAATTSPASSSAEKVLARSGAGVLGGAVALAFALFL